MANITLRAAKGSPLTHNEVDANFNNLNTYKLDTAGIALGSAASPTIKFTGDTDTGLYSPGADQIGFSTGGTLRAALDSSGRLGIGTSSPGTILDISDPGTGLRFQNAASGNFNIGLLGGTGSADTYVFNRANSPLVLGTNNTERLRIDSIGRVGIGTSSPGSLLTLKQSIAASSDAAPTLIKLENGSDGGSAIEFSNSVAGAAKIALGVEGTSAATDDTFIGFSTSLNTTLSEKVRITSAGNVGIGTSSPSALLELSGSGTVLKANTSTTAATAISLQLGGLAATSNSGCFIKSHVNLGSTLFSQLSFEVNGGALEAARIDSSGRLLVGTSSARSNVVGLAPGIQLEGSNNSTQRTFAQIYGKSDSSGPLFVLSKHRSDSVGGQTVVSSGDELGQVVFTGSDGTNFIQGASIKAAVDGTPGANDMPGCLVFSTTADGASTPTERMRINSAGELLVGYTSDNGAYLLQVNSQIFATSSTIATSDGRYKESIATLDNCVDLVKALRPVSFHWKTQQDITSLDEDGNEVLVREGHNFPKGAQVGFIAQEVQEALAATPWLGSIIKENTRPAITDADGAELAPEEQFYGIAEGNLIAVLTSALQEALTRIETLEQQVATLLP